MSFADALISLAKSQRRLAGEYAADLRAGRYPMSADKHRREIIRLRAAAREHLEWARREREWTHKMEAAE